MITAMSRGGALGGGVLGRKWEGRLERDFKKLYNVNMYEKIYTHCLKVRKPERELLGREGDKRRREGDRKPTLSKRHKSIGDLIQEFSAPATGGYSLKITHSGVFCYISPNRLK